MQTSSPSEGIREPYRQQLLSAFGVMGADRVRRGLREGSWPPGFRDYSHCFLALAYGEPDEMRNAARMHGVSPWSHAMTTFGLTNDQELAIGHWHCSPGQRVAFEALAREWLAAVDAPTPETP